MSMLPRDLLLASRALRARPGLFVVRTITLAAVIAAGSAVFVVANALVWRPLPFRDGNRLVRVYMQPPGTTSFNDANPLQPYPFVRFRAAPGSLEAIEGVWAQERAIGGDEEPDSLPTASVSAGLFQLLGSSPILGRAFTEEEAREDRKVAMLTHGLWMRRYGGDSGVVGRTIPIDRVPHEVIGVLGADFDPVFVRAEILTPLPIREGRIFNPAASFVQTVGRLKPGVTIDQALASLESTMPSVIEGSPAMLKGWRIGLRDLRDAQFGKPRRAVVLLLAAVCALALIAAANLANLTLADVMYRRGELAIRSALGASRLALIRPEVLQGITIAAAGGAAGLAIARVAVAPLVALDPSSQLDTLRFAIDWRVVFATTALALGVMAIAAVVPTLRIARADVAASLAEGGRRAAGSRSQEQFRSWLVATQTALALILVSSAALVAAAFDRTARIDPGFDPSSVLTAQLRLADRAFPTDTSRAAFVDQVLARVRAIPGVIDASTTMNLFVPGFAYQTLMFVEGKPTPENQPHTVHFRRVSPGYFRTLRIAELEGRTFDTRDVAGGLPTAVVSRSLAERYWPEGEVIGRRVRRTGATAPWLTIVGVVDDVYDVGYGQAPLPTIYLPYAQNNTTISPASLVVRTSGDPAAFVPLVKTAVREVDPAQPVAGAGTLEGFLADSLGPQRFRSVLLGIFGTLGLLLATIGIYAVTARSVVERTREVGVRLALGGSPWRVWRETAARALGAFGAGMIAGTAGSIAVAALLAGIFPEVRGTPRVFMLPAVAALLCAGIGTAVAAARRVTAVDPLRALRE